MEEYIIIMTLLGLAILGMAWIPHWLKKKPFSYPIIYIAFGVILYNLPIGLPIPDPLEHIDIAVRLTELSVIISLMGTSLKINRQMSWKAWKIPFLMIIVTMPLCIAAMALSGWWLLGLAPASAILLGAVVAPTDPVLAGDVQVGPPDDKEEDEVRFSLTAEAGMNDGLAFPFTWMAVVIAATASNENWIGEWIGFYFFYKIIAGIGIGFLAGKLLAWLVFSLPKTTNFPEIREGFVALSVTLLVYGITEIIHGYGFLAVFFTGIFFRMQKRHHAYHEEMHNFIDQIERILLVLLLIPFGGTIFNGLLDHLTWIDVVIACGFLFIIRPLSALIAQINIPVTFKEKLAISFFGIRGIGSFYYLSFAFEKTLFPEEDKLWSITGLIVLISIIIHGISAFPAFQNIYPQSNNNQPVKEKSVEEPAAD